ncbi:MAG: riboflavin synthase subunit alpha [Sulfurovum sp. PC08-66]|nr:MAG: riboflavin synthase subunit alpha [Sulfurovum sp. PC08-66]KIM12565.1 MAG: riboflavin synthase subunit alpha [Sulfuricurvum sp. PC08-66]
MFTGLIREIAHVESFANHTLRLRAAYAPKIGDSIAINGACLTVTSLQFPTFEVELSKESRDILALENYSGQVHMEPAMQLGDRIEGHMVQGHIDCIGTIDGITQRENGWDFFITMPAKFLSLMMPKGSIAIDGVSLTINDVTPKGVRLTIINHTMQNTLFASYRVGRRVNIESDMFARYLFHMLNQKATTTRDATLSWEDAYAITAHY